MKKIMFNDHYGLTHAVLEGKKTMTRRFFGMTLHRMMKDGTMEKFEPDDMFIASDGTAHFKFGDKGYTVPKQNQPAYKIGEEVAVAQPYKNDGVLTYNAYNEDGTAREDGLQRHKEMLESKGYCNKMFVKAEYMPHRIRITNIKVERLQDITEQECICEGIKIKKGNRNGERPFGEFSFDGWDDYSFTAREAFAALIDRISGRGTWQSNPWVFAYEFVLIK